MPATTTASRQFRQGYSAMPSLMTQVQKNRSGAFMIECTLIGALAVIAVISGFALFAGQPQTTQSPVPTAMELDLRK